MIDIKVGDRIAHDFLDVGVLNTCDSLRVYGYVIKKTDPIYTANSDALLIQWDSGLKSYLHRKQCRKLVKKVKCDECDGEKLCQPNVEGYDCGYYHDCHKCNGSGKVKAQQTD